MKSENKPSYITRGNVLDDLGFSPEQATALKFKADLYLAILRIAKGYSRKELEVIFDEPQPRVSELLSGKISNKSLEKLFFYAGRLGIEPKATFPQVHKDVVERELQVAGV
jgi:predicted XRE-type DNA-binding protein